MSYMDSDETKLNLKRWGAIVVILLSWMGVLCVGLLAREPMIGDEVTHYYLAVAQSRDLSTPTMTTTIPLGDGGNVTRSYPHVILWHYLAALVLRVSGGNILSVQVLHSLFWLQTLLYSWLLVKSENGESPGTLVFVTVLASLPAGLIFGVAFYQDVPAVAQMMASFYYLRQRKISLSAVFFVLAMSLKETMFVLIPAYFVVIMLVYPWKEFRWKVLVRVGLVGALFLMWFVGTTCLFSSLGQEYYPYKKVRSVVKKLGINVRAIEDEMLGRPPAVKNASPAPASTRKKRTKQVANSPGDVRNPVNLVVYGGVLFWIVACSGLAMSARGGPDGSGSGRWRLIWTGCGVWYIAVTGVVMRTAPDARFFMPAVPLLLIGLAEPASWLPRKRIWLPVLMMLAIVQSAVVLGKTYQLRHVRAEIVDAIEFLKQNPPIPNRVFMYPEGDYRLFPCPHEWYMGYDKLRDFWKADNEQRLATLRKRKVGAIVVKKWLVAPIDKNMNNLGVYPDFFVKQVSEDPRFAKAYENQDVVIYSVPAPEHAETNSNLGAKQP
jgi:hypothetical protein